jgi:hypothetical protein
MTFKFIGAARMMVMVSASATVMSQSSVIQPFGTDDQPEFTEVSQRQR